MPVEVATMVLGSDGGDGGGSSSRSGSMFLMNVDDDGHDDDEYVGGGAAGVEKTATKEYTKKYRGFVLYAGNTMSFMSQFSNINSVELDGDRVEDLRHNIGTILQGALMTEEGITPLPGSAASIMGHVTTYHGSYLDLMHSLRQDIVWLDPPWGGPEYNQGQRLEDLYLGDTAVSALCAFLLQRHANIVALRLPSSLAADTFLRLIWTSSHQLGAAETSLHRQDMTKQEVSEADEDAEGCSFFVHDSTVQMGRSTLLILVKETSGTGDAAATSDESIPPSGPPEEKRRCLAERLAIVLRDTCRAEGGLHCRSGKWWSISKET